MVPLIRWLTYGGISAVSDHASFSVYTTNTLFVARLTSHCATCQNRPEGA